MAECVQKFYLLHSFCNTSVLTFFFIFVAFFTMPVWNEISYLNCQKKRVSLSVPTINCIHALWSYFLRQDFASFRGKHYLSHELLSFSSFAIQGLWFCSLFFFFPFYYMQFDQDYHPGRRKRGEDYREDMVRWISFTSYSNVLHVDMLSMQGFLLINLGFLAAWASIYISRTGKPQSF